MWKNKEKHKHKIKIKYKFGLWFIVKDKPIIDNKNRILIFIKYLGGDYGRKESINRNKESN